MRHLRLWGWLGIGAMLTPVAVTGCNSTPATSTSEAAHQSKPAPPKKAASTHVAAPRKPSDPLTIALNRLPHNGHLAVAIASDDSPALTYNPGNHRFVQASTVKANILATLLTQQTNLTPEQEELAEAMIEYSDNDAAAALWKQIGMGAGLDTLDKRLGMTHTIPGSGVRWGLTTTTPDDQIKLLNHLAGVPYAIHLMTNVAPDQDWGVTTIADPGTYPAVKNGWLPRSTTKLWCVNSIGIVRHNGHRLYIAVFSDEQPTFKEGVRLVEQATRVAVEATTR